MLTLGKTAAAGRVATLLGSWQRGKPTAPQTVLRRGLGFGVCAMVLMALAAQNRHPLGGVWQLAASGDAVFLGGLLGGWLGGWLCLLCAVAGCALFGELGWAAGGAIGLLTLAGIVLHPWLERLAPADLGLPALARLWLARLLAEVGAVLLLGMGAGARFMGGDALLLRVAYVPISMLVLGSLLLLLRRQARQPALASAAPLAALPKRQAPGQRRQGLLHDEPLRAILVGWIGAGEAPLRYQPKCRLRTGEIIGAQALLRATDGQGQSFAPSHVLALAARHRLLVEFEWCTVQTVVRAIDLGLRAGRPLPLAVNISAASLTAPDFGVRLLALLRETGTPCRMLAVEITEASAVPDTDAVSESLFALHAAGVRLSLDDFGTGYPALSMLARFPFNEVKIDYSMVAQLHQPRMQAAVSLAYESARRYNATLVAEGVETQQQVDALLALGITRGQGFFFAPAMPIDDLLASERLSHFDTLPET